MKLKQTDGSECVHEIGQTVHPVFDNLYQKYQTAVFSFAYYLTQNRGDAEDLFQDAWFRIVKNLPEKNWKVCPHCGKKLEA